MKRLSTWVGALLVVSVAVVTTPAQEKQRPAAQGPRLPPGVKAERNIAYVPDGHERQKLDIYLPEDAKGALPVVVWIHGGGWQGGSKEGCPAVYLVPKGYAAVSVGYRLSQHATFPAQIADCKTALRFLRANAAKYHLDPDRIGVWGASAGGHLVALLGVTGTVKDKDLDGPLYPEQSSRVQGVCDWFGPTDFFRIAGKNPNATNAVAKLLGGPVAEHREKADKASPVTYVNKDAAPFLIMHGDKDPTVPLNQSELFNEALKKAGVDVTLQVLPGAGHGGEQFRTDEVRTTIQEFFDKHLKK